MDEGRPWYACLCEGQDNEVQFPSFGDLLISVFNSIYGNETRMGKGKGSFEYWACWSASSISTLYAIHSILSLCSKIPAFRVLFEIGGEPGGAELRPELARECLRLAADKLPVTVDFIDRSAPHRLGNLNIHRPSELAGKSSPEGVAALTVPIKEGEPRYLVGGANNLRVLGMEKHATA